VTACGIAEFLFDSLFVSYILWTEGGRNKQEIKEETHC